MNRRTRIVSAVALLLGPALAAAPAAAGSNAKPPAEPARIEVRVSPQEVSAGSESLVSLRLTPASGIKINRYPKIKLKIEAQPGLIGAAEAAVGNSEPPPPDRIESNYFSTVDPVEVALRLDPGASSGSHEVKGQLTYYYCVAASGFCAPKRVPVTIPITVR